MRHTLTLALALLAAAAPARAEPSLYEAAAGLALFPCDLSGLSCTTITVPLDHLANDPSKTIDITFALSFATIESKGILFYFIGGRGGSGLASAENSLASFDEGLLQYMDVVFVDQRGTGSHHGLSCPIAQARYDAADMRVDQPEAAMATARNYVNDCTEEMGQDDLLPYVSSSQAIRDSEAFRQAIGAPKVWLYGESYGTQIVQAYATAFPTAVRGVILDGVVDLSLDAPAFYRTYTAAAEGILTRTLSACAEIAGCANDMGGDAATVYDALAARLATGPIPVTLTLGNGTTVTRDFTSGYFELNAFYALYSPEGRAEYLRALAAAGRGNLVPMLHLAYANSYIDAETLVAIEDPGWYAAAFFAITCTDYDSGTGTPDERAARIMADAKAHAPNAPRLLRSYFQEQLACAYWPYQGSSQRPAPYAGGTWPTLILNADADPITPISMAYSVMDNARNAYGVFMAGGPHVIWGRGLACPDGIVSALLFDGVLPSAREQQCEQDILSDYTPLTLTDPAEMADPLAVARAVDTELYQSIPLTVWDGIGPISIGCDFGGTLTVSATYSGTVYQLEDCKFWPDLAISGLGIENNLGEPDDMISLGLVGSGSQSGEISYQYRLVDEAFSIKGSWNGQAVHLPRLP